MKVHYMVWQEGRDGMDDDLYQQAVLLIKGSPGSWPALGAAFGLPAGVFCPVIGTLLTVIASSIKLQSLSSVFNELSIATFVFTIPLLALGAHCLDLLEVKTGHPSPPDLMHPNSVLTVSNTAERRRGR